MGTTRRAPAETDRGAGTVHPGSGAFRVHGPTGQPGQGGARLHSRLCRVHCGLCSLRRLLNFQAPRRSSPARDRRPAQWTVQGPPAPCPLRDPQLSMTTGLVIHGMTGTGRAQEGVLGFPDPSGSEVAPTSREGPARSWGTHLFRRDSAGSLAGPDDGDVRASTATGLADRVSRSGSRCPEVAVAEGVLRWRGPWRWRRGVSGRLSERRRLRERRPPVRTGPVARAPG